MTKLTVAQGRELADLANGKWCSYADGYKPIIKLRDLGYVTSKPSKFGREIYQITETGRAALPTTQDREDKL